MTKRFMQAKAKTKTTTSRKLNIALLERVKRRILRRPDNFGMFHWHLKIADAPNREQLRTIEKIHREKDEDLCGTTACIAGHIQLIVNRSGHARDVAKKALGLSEPQAMRLFHVRSWPAKFYNRYQDEPSRVERVKIAIERIDHFIETKGRE
jgi:hypothetical protein